MDWAKGPPLGVKSLQTRRLTATSSKKRVFSRKELLKKSKKTSTLDTNSTEDYGGLSGDRGAPGAGRDMRELGRRAKLHPCQVSIINNKLN